jgi:iron complex outermembrane receptor protein
MRERLLFLRPCNPFRAPTPDSGVNLPASLETSILHSPLVSSDQKKSGTGGISVIQRSISFVAHKVDTLAPTCFRAWALLSCSVLLVLPRWGLAEEAQPNTDGTGEVQLQEVVVTAQKFRERLQDVPLSVSAVTGQDINAWNATSLEQLQGSIPNLSAFQYGPGVEFIQLRGISTDVGGPTVGQYVDEMSITAPTAANIYTPDIRLLDMERVEVLRGPQGALYGEGSMGGTIRYITASPSLTQYSSFAEMEGGSITGGAANYRADGVLSLPLVQDMLGLRLVAGFERDGGWIDDPLTRQSNINGTDVTTVRGKLLFKPSDQLQLSLLVQHEKMNQANQNFGTNGETFGTVPTPNDHDYDLVNGVLSYDSGPVLVTESAGYMDSHMKEQFDLTSLFTPVLAALGEPPGYVTQIAYPDQIDTRILNDELRFSSPIAGPVRWTAGAFYQRTDVSNDSTTVTAPGSLPFSLLANTESNINSEFAVYGEGSYQITQQLDALVGLRYYGDHEDQRTTSVDVGYPGNDYGNATFHSTNPHFNLRYEFSDTSMAYLNAAKGFRSGGFNLTSAGGGVVPIPPTYAPDSLWTYEIGTKQELLDRRLEFEGDVYYTDWQNVQSTFYAPGSAIQVVENGGKVDGWGTDLSARAQLMTGMTLSASYGWNNLAYRTETVDKDIGDPVDNAVHNSYSASFDYRRPIAGSLGGLLRVDYQHAGPSQITLRDYGGLVLHLPEHDRVNFRTGLDWSHYEVSVFAENLFNDRRVIIPGPYGVLSGNVEMQPRVVGLNLQAHF